MSTIRRVIRVVPKRESSDNSSPTSSTSFLFKISIEEKEESDKYGETPHPHLSLSPSSNSSLPNQPQHRINHHKQHNNNNSSHFVTNQEISLTHFYPNHTKRPPQPQQLLHANKLPSSQCLPLNYPNIPSQISFGPLWFRGIPWEREGRFTMGKRKEG